MLWRIGIALERAPGTQPVREQRFTMPTKFKQRGDRVVATNYPRAGKYWA